MTHLSHIHVTCAIIERDDLVLAAQRSRTMSLPLKWEFPGGKIITGETLEECLCREIREELDVAIGLHTPLPASTHKYPKLTVTLYPFVCSIISGELTLREHAQISWLPPDKLSELDWAEADIPVLSSYCRLLKAK